MVLECISRSAGGMDAVPRVLALLILDGDGSRLITKYYGGFMGTAAEQAAFEAKLFKKTKHTTARAEAEVIMMDSLVAIFRATSDTRFYIIGSALENELILTCVLDALHDALHTLLRGQLERRPLLDALETVMLAVDELIDGGMILESDANAIASRVQMRGAGGGDGPGAVPLADMTISQALASAKDSFLKGSAL